MDELIKELRIYANDETDEIRFDAADAIEELSAICEEQKAQIIAMAAEDKPLWIPVTERLPEEPGEYTVFIKDPFYKREDEDFISFDGSYVTTAFYDKDTGLWMESETSYYCANLSCVNTEKIFYITHWMPLPQPPKEE